MATLLDSSDVECVHHSRKSYWTALLQLFSNDHTHFTLLGFSAYVDLLLSKADDAEGLSSVRRLSFIQLFKNIIRARLATEQ